MKFSEKIKSYFIKRGTEKKITHQLVGRVRKSQQKGICFKVVPVGVRISRPIIVSAEELYELDWIKGFSEEDQREIVFAQYCGSTGNEDAIDKFPSKKRRLTPIFILLVCCLVGVLSASDHTAFKLVNIYLPGKGFSDIPVALLFFPFAYPLVAAISEHYGYQASRIAIWGGFLALLTSSTLERVAIHLPPSSLFTLDHEFTLIIGGMLDGISASLTSFLVGEFISTTIITLLKGLKTWYSLLPIRIVIGMVLGSIVDSLIFCHLAFYKNLPENVILDITTSQILVKTSYDVISALIFIPIIVKFLKRVDPVEYYEFRSSLNPFSLKMDA